MDIYLNKYLITFMDDGEGFLTAERWEVPDVGFPMGFPKNDSFLWNLMEQVDSLIE